MVSRDRRFQGLPRSTLAGSLKANRCQLETGRDGGRRSSSRPSFDLAAEYWRLKQRMPDALREAAIASILHRINSDEDAARSVGNGWAARHSGSGRMERTP